MTVRLRITNTYADRENSREVYVTNPESLDELDLEDWWDDVVWNETGDGLGGDACYTAEVLESEKYPTLLGQEREWIG